ncbi:MAG: hypothetical protein JSW26_29895 [Desulfobacterales bacterium]|nr:MAG: hypothetical protein JSW26_29895 [Desulfobacterales bacterium]
MPALWTQVSIGKRHKNRILFKAVLGCLQAALFVIIGAAVNVHAANKSVAVASENTAVQFSKFRPEVNLILNAGYRRDDLDWNIAGDSSGNNPNVLSELTWNDLESYQVKFQGSLVLPNIIALRGYADYAWIFDGENQDSDYLGDNRTYEFSRSNNKADDDNVWDASLGIGYPFRTGQTVIATVTPLVGYSHHEQNLKITDGYQTIPPLGSFSGLDSSYDTEWKGPWIGIDMRFRAEKLNNFAERFETYFSYEYHWADFYAKADWNLRDDLRHPKSFEHEADATGWIIDAGLNFILQHNIALNFDFDYQSWGAKDGNDKVFFADGTTGKTRLNEVNWSSYAFRLGLEIRF